jgi:hypothetical protein
VLPIVLLLSSIGKALDTGWRLGVVSNALLLPVSLSLVQDWLEVSVLVGVGIVAMCLLLWV